MIDAGGRYTYLVAKADTLTGVSDRLGVEVAVLAAASPSGTEIFEGQRIRIGDIDHLEFPSGPEDSPA